MIVADACYIYETVLRSTMQFSCFENIDTFHDATMKLTLEFSEVDGKMCNTRAFVVNVNSIVSIKQHLLDKQKIEGQLVGKSYTLPCKLAKVFKSIFDNRDKPRILRYESK